jgi:hypothetical protein
MSGCCGGDTAPESTCFCNSEQPVEKKIYDTDSIITSSDRLDHIKARWGINRSGWKVIPGLYKLGNPDDRSPVFVSANYKLSFDALRSNLGGVDGYILVIDTKGINVWCAAGKGSFGTAEILNRINSTGLKDIVSHRMLIVPQLGAPGVSAHEIKKNSEFTVKYGPVKAEDLPEYLETGKVTEGMRRVQFGLWDRIVLIPVELVHVLLPTCIAAVIIGWLAGPLAAAGTVAAVIGGAALFPTLLPWIPTRDFSAKGLILGIVLALLPAHLAFWGNPELSMMQRISLSLMYFLAMPPVTAFLALNFTGCSTYTSRTGVKKEMFKYIPVMAVMFVLGVAILLVTAVKNMLGGV